MGQGVRHEVEVANDEKRRKVHGGRRKTRKRVQGQIAWITAQQGDKVYGGTGQRSWGKMHITMGFGHEHGAWSKGQRERGKDQRAMGIGTRGE